MFGSISFRRILLSRILLLSVPVLTLGQFVTYRQMRLSLFVSARDGLMQSAQRKGEDLSGFVTRLRSNLSIASTAAGATADDPTASQRLLDRLRSQFPDSVACIWLESVNDRGVLANTCDAIAADVPAYEARSRDTGGRAEVRDTVTMRTFFGKNLEHDADSDAGSGVADLETFLLFEIPLEAGNANAEPLVLRLTARLPERYRSDPTANETLLSDATLIADDSGTILAYPLPGYVGQNLRDLPNYDRLLQMTIESATEFAQRTTVRAETFELDGRSRQTIVGHTRIANPLLGDDSASGNVKHIDRTWTVMAVADLDLALRNLASVRGVMLNLVLLLLAANLTATLFLARDLALPVERLGRYARSIECNTTPEALPSRFTIGEFNQLAAAMNASIERLKAWANELSAAWQQARQSNQLKSEFLTTISHELRTPLNGIIGSLQLIRDGFCEDRAEELEFLQRANDSALHLLEIIDDILDISNIEAGTVTLVPESIDLREVVLEAIEVQRHELDIKALSLELDLGEASTMVYVDASKLRRVLVNVIGNAIKFTEIGQIEIRLGVRLSQLQASFEERPTSTPISCATIEVCDTGIGIDPRFREQLFEPFVMSDGSMTRSFGGTGLGLAIARNLLEMMNGRIAIESLGVDRGTTVTIEVPLAHASTRDLASASPAPAASFIRKEKPSA